MLIDREIFLFQVFLLCYVVHCNSSFPFSRIWNALTDNYGNVMPVDWKSSHTRALHLPTLNLSEQGVSSNLQKYPF